MRVRVIRWTDPTSSTTQLMVQRWCAGQWEPVLKFELHEFDQAHEFAMKLSMTKRFPVELAVFHDGEKVEAGAEPLFITPPTVVDDKPSESSP